MATALVEMESDYITSAYFRRAIANRAMVFEEQELPESPVKGSEEEEEEEDDEEDDDDDSTEDDEDDDPKPKRAPSRRVQGDFDPNDLKAGYLEKRIGEGSGRGAIPVESWKWQKRWFIFTDTKAMLYYFKSPDDPPNYRGAINIRCAVCARVYGLSGVRHTGPVQGTHITVGGTFSVAAFHNGSSQRVCCGGSGRQGASAH